MLYTRFRYRTKNNNSNFISKVYEGKMFYTSSENIRSDAVIT